MTDCQEDGMDLGSDSSSRSCSETSSTMATPSSPRMHLVMLEDCEDDEDYQEYRRKVLGEWGGEYGDRGGGEGRGHAPVNSRSLAEEFRDIPCHPPSPSPAARPATAAAAVPDELKQNGNIIVVATHHHPFSSPAHGPRVGQRGAVGGYGGGAVGVVSLLRWDRETGCPATLPQVPPIDWAALEKHLVELPSRAWEGRGHNQNPRRTSSTSPDVGARESSDPALLFPSGVAPLHGNCPCRSQTGGGAVVGLCESTERTVKRSASVSICPEGLCAALKRCRHMPQ
ncbi:hypothetical protein AAFF_G00237370 [Aldrovandia affinis]|uniref:Uncharacterized protein n=1 Tax=Aldrovandia affinis TaxID=143900 RepID=A0AAD7REN3_9TELE|nr:hypothetical protein AAFF_G00237370 [Aldrovandia affinis]